MQHINSGNDLADNDISRIVSRIIVNLDCNVNNVDYRSEIITMLTQYTSAVLKKTGVIATGDVGLIKEATPQTMTSYTKQQLFGGGESFVLKSKKSDLNSHLYTHYQSQFDSIQSSLKNINDTSRQVFNKDRRVKFG